MHEVLQLRDGLNSEHKLRLDSMLIKQAKLAKSTATRPKLQSNAPVALPAPIPKAKWVQYRKQHDKTGTRSMTGAEIAVRAANTVEKAAKKVEDEVARESRLSPKAVPLLLWVLRPLRLTSSCPSVPIAHLQCLEALTAFLLSRGDARLAWTGRYSPGGGSWSRGPIPATSRPRGSVPRCTTLCKCL